MSSLRNFTLMLLPSDSPRPMLRYFWIPSVLGMDDVQILLVGLSQPDKT